MPNLPAKYLKNGNKYEEYNEKGQLIKSGMKNSQTGADENTTLYEYDSLGRVIKESYTYAEGELGENGTKEISYEENITKSVFKNSEGQTTHVITEETLTDGSKKFRIYSPNGIVRTESIESYDETSDYISSKIIIYDKEGNIIAYKTNKPVEVLGEEGSYIDSEEKYYNANGDEISEDEYYNLKSDKRDDFKINL